MSVLNHLVMRRCPFAEKSKLTLSSPLGRAGGLKPEHKRLNIVNRPRAFSTLKVHARSFFNALKNLNKTMHAEYFTNPIS